MKVTQAQLEAVLTAVTAAKVARNVVDSLPTTAGQEELHEMVVTRLLNAERELERMASVVQSWRDLPSDGPVQ